MSRTLETEWGAYESACLPNASDDERRAARYAFVAGASSVVSLLGEAGANLPPAERGAATLEILREVAAAAARVMFEVHGGPTG